MGVVVASSGAAAQSPPAPSPVSPIPIHRTTIAAGLNRPWSVAFLPDGGMLVTEKEGGIVRIANGGTITRIAGLPADIDKARQRQGDNSGVFGIAVHPEFARNGVIYFAYSAGDGTSAATRLTRATLRGDRLDDQKILFDATPRSQDRYHYGGGVLVGPDRMLYLSTGERHYLESDNPPLPVSLDVADRRGKIYRFDLDGQPARGNPNFGPTAVPGLFALGIRATQGMAVQPGTGRVWFSEHGTIRGDEINILAAGANYGWPVRTTGGYRAQEYRAQSVLGTTYTDPVFSWLDRTVAPTGLAFYRGSTFPEWDGDLLVAGLSRGYLMRLDVERDRVVGVEYLLEDRPVRLRSVQQGPDGHLYILTDEADGKVIRLDRGR